MTDPRVRAFLKLGAGRMGSVSSPKWRDIVAGMHGQQRRFVECTTSGAIAKAGRGAGKSFGMAAKFHRPSAAHPGCSSVFIALSGERARDILLPGVWKLNEKHGLGITERRKDNALVWENGYRVLMRGCKDRTECNKRRGTPWVVAIWDECDAINSDLLRYDIHDVVEPRLMDYKGTWGAGGTPGVIPHGYWHELSGGKHPHYPMFEWDARSNPHVNAIEYFVAKLQSMQGVPERALWPAGVNSLLDIIARPELWNLLPALFVREYLGKWVLDLRSLVYKLTPRNAWDGNYPIEPDQFTCGVDFGNNNPDNPNLDHAAYTVASSHHSLPFIWIPESRSWSDVSIDGFIYDLVLLQAKYPGITFHIDPAAAGKLMEITLKRMGLPVMTAIRSHKQHRIHIVQSKIDNGNIQIHMTDALDLRREATSLVWNEDRTSHSEKCKDDNFDSLHYAVAPHVGNFTPQEVLRPDNRDQPDSSDLEEYESALREAIDEAA